MTPKETAKELFDKNYQIFLDDKDEHFVGTAKRISKQCALIAVENVIENVIMGDSDEIFYWMEVKQEIKKL